jgi:hypothetical protein
MRIQRWKYQYKARGIDEVQGWQLFPTYELGTYRWLWQAKLLAWLHLKAQRLGLNKWGETWIEAERAIPT